MKTKPYHPIRALREILGQTQAELAAMIGASKDTVVSWETGRNKVSPTLARRIALVTGVDEGTLFKTRGPLLTQSATPKRPYTREEFNRHRERVWGDAPEKSVRRWIEPCADTLELMFLAAAKVAQTEGCSRLPGLLDSFIQWCHQARADFELSQAIDAELAQRTSSLSLTQTYGQWRQMAKEAPGRSRLMGFKDVPEKDDHELLTLNAETVPTWMPGKSMRARAPKGQTTVLRPHI